MARIPDTQPKPATGTPAPAGGVAQAAGAIAGAVAQATPQPAAPPQPSSTMDSLGFGNTPSWQSDPYSGAITNQPQMPAAMAPPASPPGAPAPPLQQYPARVPVVGTAVQPIAEPSGRAVFDPYSYLLGGDSSFVPRMAEGFQANAAAGAASQYALANNTFGVGQNAAQSLYNQGWDIAGQSRDTASALSQSAAGLGQTGQALNAAGQAATQRTTGNEGASALYRTGLTAEQMALQNRGTAGMDFGMQNSMLGRAEQGAAALGGLEATQGPSAAQAQLQSATNQAIAQQTALARSGRGWGGGAQAQSEAMRANAATGQQAANASAMLRAQEDAAWRQRQAANLGASSQLQQGIAGQYGGATTAAMDSYIRQQAQNDARVQGLLGLGQQGFAGYNQAALANQGQNDAYSAQLLGLGLQAQGAQQDARLAAANYGLAGATAGAGVIAQGAQTGLTANQMAAGMTAEGTGQINAGLTSSTQLAQAQLAAEIAREQAAMQYYGIRQGVAINNAQMQNQLIGSGIQAAGTALAGGIMALSDIRAKKNVRPLGEVSPYESDLDPAAETGEELDASEDERMAQTGESLDAAFDPYDSGLNGRVLGPDQDQYARSMLAAKRAEELDASNADARQRRGLGMLAGAAGQFGQGFGQRSQSNPILDRYLPNIMVSDEEAKESLRSAEMTPGYAYEYRDPARHGNGTHYGPMAQDLAKTPAGRSTLSRSPDGYLQVDTGRLALVDHAAIGELARQVKAMRDGYDTRPRRRKA